MRPFWKPWSSTTPSTSRSSPARNLPSVAPWSSVSGSALVPWPWPLVRGSLLWPCQGCMPIVLVEHVGKLRHRLKWFAQSPTVGWGWGCDFTSVSPSSRLACLTPLFLPNIVLSWHTQAYCFLYKKIQSRDGDHSCNPSSKEAEAGGLQVSDQPGQNSETPFQGERESRRERKKYKYYKLTRKY